MMYKLFRVIAPIKQDQITLWDFKFLLYNGCFYFYFPFPFPLSLSLSLSLSTLLKEALDRHRNYQFHLFFHFSPLLERERKKREKEGFSFFLEFEDSLWRCLILWAYTSFKFFRFHSLLHSFSRNPFPFHPINHFVSSTNPSKLKPHRN